MATKSWLFVEAFRTENALPETVEKGFIAKGTDHTIRTKAEPQYTVRHGVTKNRLTKPLPTLSEADAAAIRLSLDRSYIVEVWHRDRVTAWYADGVRG